MGIVTVIQSAVSAEIKQLYKVDINASDLVVSETKPEFEGDYTVVLFALVKQLKKSPELIGNELGELLVLNNPQLFPSFNVIKGFLNITVGDNYWLTFLHEHFSAEYYGFRTEAKSRVMIEYSSPNTNKPLHLGHLRNNFLGWSMAEIYKATGNEVIKSCIVNDRGIHICKSMLSWKKFGSGETPVSSGKKGDHLVGDYYVKFENALKQEAAPLIQDVLEGKLSTIEESDQPKLLAILNQLKTADSVKAEELHGEINTIVRNSTPLMQEVREMLLKWEAGDPEIMHLWRQMNSWVYDGFGITYKKIGSDFDRTYYESETYLLGKEFVEKGLSDNLFTKKEDGSVWIDLTGEGLDEKLLLRRDGTSVYITQDLGLAKQKYEEYKPDCSIYVIADEQNYHMKVLKLICQKLNMPNADGILHLSYGMVELPSGRMKSREGTVVDADDIVLEMELISAKHTLELGKVKDFSAEDLNELYNTLGLGALKFFLLRVDPKKRIVFNPEESIDFHGFTGPFIQYTHARTKSILRKEQPKKTTLTGQLLPTEKQVLLILEKYPSVIEQAAIEMNPSLIASYVFSLAQTFNSFIAELRILTAESDAKKELRLQLAQMTVNVIKSGMGLLGIKVPDRM